MTDANTLIKGAAAAVAGYGTQIAIEQSHLPDNDGPIPYDGRVEVHVPTLNESEYIEDTLQSLVNQHPIQAGNVPIKLVDSRSDDGTQSIARQYVDEIITVDRGKLTARNQSVKRTDADVIAYADSGDIYPKGWLRNIVAPFTASDTVATYGPKFGRDFPHRVYEFAHTFALLGKYLPANNCAIDVKAFKTIGMFDESINQQDHEQVWREEELGLMQRLPSVGEVDYVRNAPIYVSSRHLPLSPEKKDQYVQDKKQGVRF